MTNISKQTTADLIRLGNSKATEFLELLPVLLTRGEALLEVAKLVEQRIDNGDYVLSEPLADLLSRTKMPSLYMKCRERLFSDSWALIKLQEGHYPDMAIEEALADQLYKIASNDGEPRRRFIALCLRDFGSSLSLPVLEAILFDHAPTLKAKKVISDAVESVMPFTVESLLSAIELKSRTEFLVLIAEAIQAISTRNISVSIGSIEEIELKPSIGYGDFKPYNAVFGLNQAIKYLDSDPTTSVYWIRKGTEAIGKDLYRKLGYQKNGKPINKMMLDELVKVVRDSDVSDLFKHCFATFQSFGNFATHDQDDQEEHLTKEIALPLIDLFKQALVMYSNWASYQTTKTDTSNV